MALCNFCNGKGQRLQPSTQSPPWDPDLVWDDCRHCMGKGFDCPEDPEINKFCEYFTDCGECQKSEERQREKNAALDESYLSQAIRLSPGPILTNDEGPIPD